MENSITYPTKNRSSSNSNWNRKWKLLSLLVKFHIYKIKLQITLISDIWVEYFHFAFLNFHSHFVVQHLSAPALCRQGGVACGRSWLRTKPIIFNRFEEFCFFFAFSCLLSFPSTSSANMRQSPDLWLFPPTPTTAPSGKCPSLSKKNSPTFQFSSLHPRYGICICVAWSEFRIPHVLSPPWLFVICANTFWYIFIPITLWVVLINMEVRLGIK